MRRQVFRSKDIAMPMSSGIPATIPSDVHFHVLPDVIWQDRRFSDSFPHPELLITDKVIGKT